MRSSFGEGRLERVEPVSLREPETDGRKEADGREADGREVDGREDEGREEDWLPPAEDDPSGGRIELWAPSAREVVLRVACLSELAGRWGDEDDRLREGERWVLLEARAEGREVARVDVFDRSDADLFDAAEREDDELLGLEERPDDERADDERGGIEGAGTDGEGIEGAGTDGEGTDGRACWARVEETSSGSISSSSSSRSSISSSSWLSTPTSSSSRITISSSSSNISTPSSSSSTSKSTSTSSIWMLGAPSESED